MLVTVTSRSRIRPHGEALTDSAIVSVARRFRHCVCISTRSFQCTSVRQNALMARAVRTGYFDWKTSGWRPRDHSLSSVRTLVLLCRVCASRLTVWFPCVSIALNVVPTARAAMDAQIDMNGMNTSILAADNEGTGTEFLWGFLMGLLLGVFMLLMVSWHPCKCVEIPLNLQLT